MSLRTAPRAGTRERLLDIALRLFAERGYAGTSIRDIAEELQVTKAAVHYHFPSKEGIVSALLEPFIGRFDELAAELSPGPVDGRLLLRRLREVLDEASPLLTALTNDPSVAAACGDLHADAEHLGDRLAEVLVGAQAPRLRRLRAHACLGAFFAGYQHALRTGHGVRDEDVDCVVEAALAALG